MNNFFLGQGDPLLNNVPSYGFTEQTSNQQQSYAHMYNGQQKDWIGELDNITRRLDTDMMSELTQNTEYISLSNELQSAIQVELMNYVKGTLNMNSGIISNIKRQMEIISNVKEMKDNENKQNMSDLNDYIKNYSHLSFDEYKKAKQAKTKVTKNKAK